MTELKVIAATGHRIQAFAEWERPESQLFKLAAASLEAEKPDQVISGMALGWDMAIARAAVDAKIPLIAAIPFPQQADRWSEEDRWLWEELVGSAIEQVYMIDGEALTSLEPNKRRRKAIAALMTRNEWMVQRVEASEHPESKMLALYNHSPQGGTAACIRYADRRGVTVRNLWGSWTKHAKKF